MLRPRCPEAISSARAFLTSKIALIAVLTGVAAAFALPSGAAEEARPAAPSPASTPPAAAPGAADKFDQAAALAALRKEIAGKEQKPAKEVFKNIQLFKEMPAERLLKIMEFGWSRALGVTCTHCHDAAHWDSDDKRPKLAAREMAAFTGKLNHEGLAGLKNLRQGKPPPTVNCTTCHRGQVQPALDLEH